MFGSLKQRGGTIVVAAIVGAVAAGSPAVASEVVAFAKSAGNANTVNKIGASKTPRAGMLVALNSKGQFPTGVIPASRQAIGQAGPAGPQGTQGPQGASGPAGANGATGAQGPKGLTGADGAIGPKGDNGDTGEPGTDGTNGTNGATGAKGDKGDKGEPGTDGTNGANGANGATGATGAKGDKGDKGDKGEPGSDGTNGTNGTDGATGAKGEKGDKGDQGAQGPAGGLVYPSLVDVNPVPQASDAHLWGTVQINSQAWNNAYRSSFPAGDQTSYLEWQVPLAAGTWSMEVTHVTADDAGIMTFSVDATDIGSVDAYAPVIEHNVRASISSITVGASGMHTIRVRTDAKNAASSNYFGYLVWLRLVKQ